MGISRLYSVLCALALGKSALAAPQLSPRATASLDTWLASETTISLNGILDNIGASGAYAASAKPGVVIASPSTSNPDCKSTVHLGSSIKFQQRIRLLHLDQRLCSHIEGSH